jgi:hypothetical protein
MAKRYDITGVGSSIELGKQGLTLADSGGSLSVNGDNVSSQQESALSLSTGSVGSVSLTINADPTKFDLSITDAVFIDHTYGSATPITSIGAQSFVGVSSPLTATQPSSFIGIDSTGTLQYNPEPFSEVQRRTIVQLGFIVHVDNINITSATAAPVIGEDNTQLLLDLTEAIGGINISGNEIEPNSSDLSIAKTAGKSFGRSISYESSPQSPNYIDSPLLNGGGTGATFFS